MSNWNAAVKRQLKRNHYTCTPIANITEWRYQEAVKQAKWDSEQEARYTRVREAAMAVVKGEAQGELVSKLDELISNHIDERNKAKKPVTMSLEEINKRVKAMKEKEEEHNKLNGWMWSGEEAKPTIKQKILNFLRKAFP